MSEPILAVDKVTKHYSRGLVNRQVTFSLAANFTFGEPGIVGVMGPNGSGKTTLFELITGSNLPSSGRVLCQGRDIHQVRYLERDRLAIHYHQSYQVRHFKRTRPSFMLQPANSEYPMVHLFDEPQFNTQDGYIGFMLDFFRKLKHQGRLVFLCLHPTERYHLEIMQEVCEKYLFVSKGEVTQAANLPALYQDQRVQAYLGRALP